MSGKVSADTAQAPANSWRDLRPGYFPESTLISVVIPAKAGIQCLSQRKQSHWVPDRDFVASGMTSKNKAALVLFRLGLVPKRVLLRERFAVELFAICGRQGFHPPEATLELGIGVAQRRGEIHARVARKVHQHERDVADLVQQAV